MTAQGVTGASQPLVDWADVIGRPTPALDHDAVRARVAGQTVMVTGAAGSLGVPLALAIAAHGPARLTLFDWHESSLFRLRQAVGVAYPGLAVTAILGDVRDTGRLHRAMDGAPPKLLFHLAAYKHVPWGEEDPEAFASVNILGARSVIEVARAVGVGRVIYPSTDKAIDPPSLYGATKRLVEAQFRISAGDGGPSCTLVRFVNVLGSQGSAPEIFVQLLRHGRALTVTDPRMRRFWITPEHATVLLLHGACLDDRAVTAAPDAGEEVAVVDIAARLTARYGPPNPPPISITGTRPGERLAEPLVAPHERLEAVGLAGLFAVRGQHAVNPEAVRLAVAQVADALALGRCDDDLRALLFRDTWTVQ